MGARVLVTGISGLLGSNLARVADQTGYEVTGTYQLHPVSLPATRCLELNLECPGAATELVDYLRPEAVIHAAAMARPDECARDPERCRAVNVNSTRELGRAAARCGAKFVFLSSDLVYGARGGELTEDMPGEPLGVYANSKLQAEGAALEETEGSAFIARTALIYGWGTGATMCTFEDWLHELRAGRRIRAFTNQRRCPTYAIDLANQLLLAVRNRLEGVYNVAGPDFCSRYDFAGAMAREFDLDASLIEPFSIDDFAYSDPRPRELRLSIVKLQSATGYAPMGISEALRELHRRELG